MHHEHDPPPTDSDDVLAGAFVNRQTQATLFLSGIECGVELQPSTTRAREDRIEIVTIPSLPHDYDPSQHQTDLLEQPETTENETTTASFIASLGRFQSQSGAQLLALKHITLEHGPVANYFRVGVQRSTSRELEEGVIGGREVVVGSAGSDATAQKIIHVVSDSPVRRLSPWRLFDANSTDPNARNGSGASSVTSSPVRYDANGNPVPEGRKSTGGTSRRQQDSTKLAEPSLSTKRALVKSRGSMSSGITVMRYNTTGNYANTATPIVRNLTTSVGELFHSSHILSALRSSFGGAAVSNVTGGSREENGGGSGNPQYSTFENGVRALTILRDSAGSLKLNGSNGSFLNARKASVSDAGKRSGLVQESAGDIELGITALNDGNTVDKLLNSKIIFIQECSPHPISVFSVISNIEKQPKKEKKSKKNLFNIGSQPFADRFGFTMDAMKKTPKVKSYMRHVEPTGLLGTTVAPEYDVYNPLTLDDPELKTGKHRTVIKLPFFVSSIFLYSRPADIKRELNEHFRETHPSVDSQLTLSQIRNLKTRMIEIGRAQDMELSSVALAFVYFEKLVIKNFATKANRRLIASVCLLLAAKVNDPKEVKYNDLLEVVERVLEIPPKEVYQHEFSVYAALEFNLFIPLWQIMPHLERIIEATGQLDNPPAHISTTKQHRSDGTLSPSNTAPQKCNTNRPPTKTNANPQDDCDPADILGTVLVDPVGHHAVRMVSVIGTGSFAHVYLAESVAVASSSTSFESEKRAVKRLFKAGLDERQLVLQRQEAEVMKSMDPHPNVIQLLATVEDADCLYLIMEYCELDLYEAITQQGGFPEDVVKEVFVQIADAVLHCHNSGWFHRDLKPENCLISTANYKVKLADFGLTTAEEWSTELGCGSVRYMAPECFDLTHNTPEGLSPGQPVPPPAKSLPVPPGVLSGGYSPAANDVWALGVILLNLLFGKNPWFEAHMTDAIFSAFAISNPNILRQQFNLTLQFDAILRRVFELDPRRRCSVQDLKLLVESVTHFVEKDTAPSSLPTSAKSTANNRLKRRGHSSILAGPGYILAPGEPLPLLFSAPTASSSPRKTSQPLLRTKETISNLKAAVTATTVSAVASDAESQIVKTDSAALSHVSISTHVPEEIVQQSAVLTNVSPVARASSDADLDDAGCMSMSSSSTVHEDDGEGDFVVMDAVADSSDANMDIGEVEEIRLVPEETDVTQIHDGNMSHEGHAIVVDFVDDVADHEDVESRQENDSIRRAMNQEHVDRMMADDLESVEGSLLATPHVTDGSLRQASLAADDSVHYTDSAVDSQPSGEEPLAVEEVALAESMVTTHLVAVSSAEQHVESEVSKLLPDVPESIAPAAEPTILIPASDVLSMEASLPTPSTIAPPSMERQESLINPARQSTSMDPGAAAALFTNNGPGISQASSAKRSPSPLKWFGPFISRESARVSSGADASAGKIGVFRIVKKKSSVLLKKPVVDVSGVELSPNGSNTSAIRPGSPFNIIRKRRSSPTSGAVNGKHMSTATTVVNGDGSSHQVVLETASSSLAGLEIEDAVSSLSGSGKEVAKRKSTMSMKEFSSGLKGAFGIKKRPDALTEERN
ncbi:hypothetical protein HDU80_000173 [Chytriomyces hyalinus]|nr:hypothetical protein HDU80_000173 [Chytriomyces hyalinus]